MTSRERDGERQLGAGAETILTKVKRLCLWSLLPPHFCFSPVVVTVSVTNKEVRIKSTIFRMTLCVLV